MSFCASTLCLTLFPYTTLFRSLSRENGKSRDLIPENYNFTLEGSADVDGQPCYVLGLHPKHRDEGLDRKSTRLNSSHPSTSYAGFCLYHKNLNTRIDRLGRACA